MQVVGEFGGGGGGVGGSLHMAALVFLWWYSRCRREVIKLTNSVELDTRTSVKNELVNNELF